MSESKKSTNNVLDITKTGPLNYRQLQTLNGTIPGMPVPGVVSGVKSAGSSIGKVNYNTNPAFADFGNSKYDSGIVSYNELQDYQTLRGDRQPWYAQLGAGLAKGAVLAGTTFLEGTIGLVLGLGQAIAKGDGSKVWDNDFNKAMQTINDYAEKELPNYYSYNELNSSWWENLGTANFWGDKFIKNLGFSVGAIYSGGVFTAGFKATQIPRLIAALTKSTEAAKMVTTAVGAVASATTEGSIEAINNSNEFVKNATAELDSRWEDYVANAYKGENEDIQDRLNQAIEEYQALLDQGPDNGPFTSEARQVELAEAKAKCQKLKREQDMLIQRMEYDFEHRTESQLYQQALAKIEEDRVHFGNTNLLGNIGILTISNLSQFSRFYGRGFNTAKKTGVRTVDRNIEKQALRQATKETEKAATEQAAKRATSTGTKDAAKGAANTTAKKEAKEVISETPLYEGKKVSNWTKAYRAVKNPAIEGTEEISQKADAAVIADYYSKDVRNFVSEKIDPDAEQEVLDWWKSTMSGIAQTVSDSSSWEEFFIGALTGGMGIPMFRGIRSADGKLQSPIKLEGGIINEIKKSREQAKRSQLVADYLNGRVQSPEFLNYYRGLIRSRRFQAAMNKAAQDDDKFDFKNAEHAQLISDIEMFHSAGRLDDLKAFIQEAYDISDENLESIFKNTTSKNEKTGKYSGPFSDAKGTPLYSTKEGKKEMIDALTWSRDNLMKNIDYYTKTMREIDSATNGALNDEQLSELTFIKSQINDWQGRIKDIIPKVKETLKQVSQTIQTNIDNSFKNISEEENEAASDETKGKEMLFKMLGISPRRAEHLMELAELSDKKLAAVLSNPVNVNATRDIIDQIENLGSDIIGGVDKSNLVAMMKDIPRIGEGITKYQEKLEEYLGNPEKLAEDIENSKQNKAKKFLKKKSKNLKQTLSNTTSTAEFRQAIEEEEDDEVIQNTLKELDEEKNPLAKNYKETNEYNSEIKKALSELGLDSRTAEDAAALWQEQFNNTENIDQIADPKSVYLNDNDTFFDGSSNGNVAESLDRYTNALYAVQQAMNKVNNNIKFRDRFSPEFKEAPVKVTRTTSKATTGSSEVGAAPSVNGNNNSNNNNNNNGTNTNTGVINKSKDPKPRGDISKEEVADENKELATLNSSNEVEPTGLKQYYKPAIPELHIEASKKGDFRKFWEVMKDQGMDFQKIYEYLESEGAFEYVNNGNVKKDDEIGFMIDPSFEASMEGYEWYKGPTIFLVHGPNNQVVGSLQDTNAANFEGLPETIERIRNEYKMSKFIHPNVTFTEKILERKDGNKRINGKYTVTQKDGFTTLTYEGTNGAQKGGSIEELAKLGITKEDILGERDSWNDPKSYDEAYNELEDIKISKVTIFPSGAFTINISGIKDLSLIEGKGAEKIATTLFPNVFYNTSEVTVEEDLTNEEAYKGDYYGRFLTHKPNEIFEEVEINGRSAYRAKESENIDYIFRTIRLAIKYGMLSTKYLDSIIRNEDGTLSMYKDAYEEATSILHSTGTSNENSVRSVQEIFIALDSMKSTASQNSQRFIATSKTRVSKMMIGKVPYTQEEKSLSDIPKANECKLGIIKQNTMVTNDSLPDSKVKKPYDTANKEGRVYLLIPNGAGSYSPVAVRVKHFNKQEFDLSDSTVANTPRGKALTKAISAMANSRDETDLENAVTLLDECIYTGNLHINFVELPNGETKLNIIKVELNEDGYEKYVNGKRVEDIKWITISRRNPSTLELEYANESKIVQDISNALMHFNAPLQISVSKINSGSYNQEAIDSGILTSNIESAEIKGTWFTTNFFNKKGVPQSAVNPKSKTPEPTSKPTPTNTRTNPVGGAESVVKGIEVSIGDNNYLVDLASMTYTDKKTGTKYAVTTSNSHIFATAWAQNKYGDLTEAEDMTENKIITPNGKVLDRTTGTYVSEQEATRIKNKLHNKNRKAVGPEVADQVIADMKENQQKVDKSKTDADYYYILEEDGQYHPYDRIHKRLGNNWTQSEKQTKALKAIREELDKHSSSPEAFDKLLDSLSTKWEVNLDEFKGKTDNKSKDTIVLTIRDKMSNTNSKRALEAGSSIDTIIRDVLAGRTPVKPDNISDSAFNSFVQHLQEVRQKGLNEGGRFITDNIVLYQKFPDGTRVAGEVDIIYVDKNGNFSIIDAKTSRWSFEDFIDKKGRKKNYFVNKGPSQTMSTKEYYSLQLSGYENLFRSQYGVQPAGLSIFPFVLEYGRKETNTENQVINIVSQARIPMTYNSKVNVPLVDKEAPVPKASTAGPTVTTTSNSEAPSSSTQTKEPIFNSSHESKAPINKNTSKNKLPGNNPVGYYEVAGKIYKGELMKVEEVNGEPIYMTRQLISSMKGISGEELDRYHVFGVFKNGKTFNITPDGVMGSGSLAVSIEELAERIMGVVKRSAAKVPQLANEETSLTKGLPKESTTTTSEEKKVDNTVPKPESKPTGKPDNQSNAGKSLNDAKAASQSKTGTGTRLRDRRRKKLRATDSNRKLWNKKKELKWLARVLPQLSKEDRLKFSEGLIKAAEEGPEAWGMFEDGIVTLSDIAAEGTAYHEAFHVVFNMLLSDEERLYLLEEARKIYGNKDITDLEEDLAEGFREYIVSQEERSLGKRILDFFKNLFAKVTNWNYVKPSINNYYRMINQGRYRKDSLSKFEGSRLRQEEYTSEMQSIKDKAIADGTFMKAPNGKPTNLNERQWLQVRTKNFINWFGDWINNPKEASKVVDENGEPLVVYHSSPEYNITVFRNTDSTSFIQYPNETIEEAINRYKELGYEISSEQIDNIRKNNYDRFENPIILTKPNGIYAASNRKVSETYITRESYEEGLYLDGEVYPVFLNIRDNNIIEGNNSNWNEIQYKGKTVSTRELETEFRGIKDGVIIKNIFDFGSPVMDTHKTNLSDIFIVFNPNQIKSATSNTGEFSTTNDDIRYRIADSSVDGVNLNDDNFKDLKKDIQSFFDNFGITLRDVSKFESEEPIFNALDRVINYTNIENLTDNAGYAIAFMMQWNPKIKTLIGVKLANTPTMLKSMRRSFNKRGDFNIESMDEKTYNKLDKTPYLKEIGKDIAIQLRALYSGEEINSSKGFFQTLWQLITEFFEKLTPVARSKFNIMKNYTNSIANAVKLGDYTVIRVTDFKPGTDSMPTITDMGEAFKENPYEEAIVSDFNKLGIALAGGASIAAQGTLLRPAENPLHDLDFNAVGYTVDQLADILKNRFPFSKHTNTINDGPGKTTETFLVMDREIEERRGVNAKGISCNIIYDKKTGERLGTRIHSDLVIEKKGVQGKMLDFFTGEGNKTYPNIPMVFNGKLYLFSDYRNAMIFKINKARLKDIWDYNRFIPRDENGKIKSLASLKNSDEDTIREKIENARIIWGHPAIGKTTYLQRNNDIIEWDEEVNSRRNEFFRDQIDPEHKMNMESQEYKSLRSQYMNSWESHPEYIDFLIREWTALKEKARRENKRIFASPGPLMTLFANDFDLFVALPEKIFIERNMARKETKQGSIGWKQVIDRNLAMTDPNKIVYTTKYFSEFMRDALGVQWGTLTNEELDMLKSRGWTKDRFDSLSQQERDNVTECMGLY